MRNIQLHELQAWYTIQEKYNFREKPWYTINTLLRYYTIFSSILSSSNVKTQNFKVLHLIESYNDFDIKSLFI
jgi:hypothetical protein